MLGPRKPLAEQAYVGKQSVPTGCPQQTALKQIAWGFMTMAHHDQKFIVIVRQCQPESSNSGAQTQPHSADVGED